MTLQELFEDQGIDPEKLLGMPIGTPLEEGGGITLSLADGLVDLHILWHPASAER